VQDPRPVLETSVNGTVTVVGVRCRACGHSVAYRRPACPVCGAAVAEATFGPSGIVWSHTRVRIPVGERVPPYDLVYVDLQDGPRILAHGPAIEDEQAAPAFAIGDVVELRCLNAAGDPTVQIIA